MLLGRESLAGMRQHAGASCSGRTRMGRAAASVGACLVPRPASIPATSSHRQLQDKRSQRGLLLPNRQRPLAPCRATLDSPEIEVLVEQMKAMRPAPAPREQLQRCLDLIDDINSKDPSKVEYGGKRVPYRLLYSGWLSEWVEKLDPGAPDELRILARGKAVESWRLSEIKRDDYSPNTAGQRQWEADRRAWLAGRLKGIVKEAGYPEASQKLVEDFMLGRDLPDPRDVRLYDVTGPLSTVNYRLLELLLMVQTLRDAEGLVFLQHTFPRMFEELPADEVVKAVRSELGGMSKRGIATALQLPWSPLQRKLLATSLPLPPGWGEVLRGVEGAAAASTHPGDWRFKDFDYD
ncbi:hypothetical protein Agub_g11911 [Astrephomene gubernaculifera]|uniref:Uncharacterized protein n=1 Tax=Astrephomene gubernaculifera TaxID=47775 RepID=A0AAD3DXL5_9CHLO|nr:hypothetical protein Agub_g11911 [Astrephomene gubernaculifera]